MSYHLYGFLCFLNFSAIIFETKSFMEIDTLSLTGMSYAFDNHNTVLPNPCCDMPSGTSWQRKELTAQLPCWRAA